MTRLVCAFLSVLLITPATADTGTHIDLFLQHIIRAYDLRPLPTKAFEETEKYKLGRALFFDPLLSGNRDVSCATCHLLTRGTSDALPVSLGTGGDGLAEDRTLPSKRARQPRNALDLWNRDNNRVKRMFWDGRVEALDPVARTFHSPLGDKLPDGLENLMAVQALFPLVREDEMLGVAGDSASLKLPAPHAGAPNEFAVAAAALEGPARIEAVHEVVMSRMLGGRGTTEQPWHQEYRALFQAAYPAMSPDEFSIVQLANALSHFEEIAFATRQAPWDAYLAGSPRAIDEDAKRGAFLFFGKARCVVCHEGPLFSDFEFHGIGVKNDGPGFNGMGDDQGRHYVTGRPVDRYKFRTPPLRNVTLTAPYFHNGTALTLRDAIAQHVDPFRFADQYQESGAFLMNLAQVEAISPILEAKLRLSEDDINFIIAFLGALEDPGLEFIDRIIPASVPSGLPVERLKARLVSYDKGG
jgi:cytochrome c peroxidase